MYSEVTWEYNSVHGLNMKKKKTFWATHLDEHAGPVFLQFFILTRGFTLHKGNSHGDINDKSFHKETCGLRALKSLEATPWGQETTEQPFDKQ